MSQYPQFLRDGGINRHVYPRLHSMVPLKCQIGIVFLFRKSMEATGKLMFCKSSSFTSNNSIEIAFDGYLNKKCAVALLLLKLLMV